MIAFLIKGKSPLLALIISTQFIAAQNAPIAVDDTFIISNGNSVLLPVLSNDYDADGDPLTVTVFTLPFNGNTTVSGNQFNYTANTGFTGTDSFTYTACDTTLLCDTATVYLTIIAGNASPVAINDYYTLHENASTPLPITANDFDPEGDALNVSILTLPQNGTVTVSGSEVVYTSTPNYFGTDTFTYIICDGQNDCDTATVYITIIGVNSPPIAENDIYAFDDTVITYWLNVLGNDTDPEDDTLFVAAVFAVDTLNNIGSVNLDSISGVMFLSRNRFRCGSQVFRYVVCDRLSCDTAEINITIDCPEYVFLPQGFSPDGDGKNDMLVFTGLQYFGPASLHIFNRYGAIVYESDDYKNDWEGTYIENGKPLPDGTYFYILQLSSKRKYNNYIIINR